MRFHRWWAGSALLLAAGGAIALAISGKADAPANQESPDRPTLALLTSLPLVFGERFGLDGGGSPALTRMEQSYKVLPIGVADAPGLAGSRLLLMAHPRAQPAEALVDLDRWVRRGGRLLLLADPMLSWESSRPIGDPLRPPPAFADTGLLAHWGLHLAGPGQSSVAGNGETSIDAVSPGRLTGKGCEFAGGGFVARCSIGKGRVTVIADADFLNGEPKGLDLLMDELSRLESR